MKYLVTGSGGFAGQYLVRHLKELGHTVIGLDRKQADLLDRTQTERAIKRARPDGIFHLAAPHVSSAKSWGDPEQTINENLAATVNVLGAARLLSKPPKFLFVSSSEVFGATKPADQPLAENQPLAPASPYGESKVLCESACRFYAECFGLPLVIVRPFNHTGPGQIDTFVIPSFAKQIAKIERTNRGTIKVGNIKVRRDISDVRDIVRAYAVLMKKGKPGETYHVGAGSSRPIADLLRLLIKRSPATIKVVVDRKRFRPTDTPVIQSNLTKVKKLGWKPAISIETTLAEILEAARTAPK